MAKTASAGEIRVGIGGWTYEPWRGGAFYPKGHAQARELHYASRAVTTIEINGTFYSTQKPSSFRKWADETPDDFVFSVKAHRLATNRRVLAEAGPSIERFLTSGLSEMGPKLGPILWQFANHKKFEPEDFEAFLALLPKTLDGLKLRHAVEVRHESFVTPQFAALARKYGAAIVYAHHEIYPGMADVTADFVYARLQQTRQAREDRRLPLFHLGGQGAQPCRGAGAARAIAQVKRIFMVWTICRSSSSAVCSNHPPSR
jgi:uncharacterized protein YecE (DUF72 family)